MLPITTFTVTFYSHFGIFNFERMVCAADHECLIDRYDGRSMLDHIPVKSSKSFSVKSKDLNLLNYERYRSIVEFYKEKSVHKLS